MPIVSLYSGLLAILLIVLSMKVATARKKNSIGIGDGDNKDLARAIRVQGNFVEYAPLGILLLAIFEYNAGNFWIAHGTGAALLLGRLMHAYGLSKTVGISVGRFAGMTLTWLSILVLALANIYYSFT